VHHHHRRPQRSWQAPHGRIPKGRQMNPAEYWLFSLFFITAGWWLHKWLGE
jgi:hypothetical protein